MALKHAMQVATGIAKVSLAPIGKVTASTAWEELFYTLRDSVSITQAAPTKTEINVDQTSTAVAVTYEYGEFTVEMDVPDIAGDIIKAFFKMDTTDYAPAGAKAHAIKLDTNIVKKMVKIGFTSGQEIIFTNAEMVANFDGSGLSTSALNIHLTITAKAAVGGTSAESAELIVINPGETDEIIDPTA